jgi:hypothetical protein
MRARDGRQQEGQIRASRRSGGGGMGGGGGGHARFSYASPRRHSALRLRVSVAKTEEGRGRGKVTPAFCMRARGGIVL